MSMRVYMHVCIHVPWPLRTEILINFIILDLKTALPKNAMELPWPNAYAIKLHPLNFKGQLGFCKCAQLASSAIQSDIQYTDSKYI